MGGAKRKASEPAAKPAKKPAAEPAEAKDAAPSSTSDATVLPLQVNPKRVQTLRDGEIGEGPIIYWMSRDQRVKDNWALLHACEVAANSGAPVAICFNLVPEYLNAGARQFGFMLRGLKELAPRAAALNIPFFLFRGDPSQTVPAFVRDAGAALLVTDYAALRLGRQWRKEICEKIEIPFHEVDAHNVVPVWEASQKREYGARTIRGKIHKHLPEYLREYPPLPKQAPWPSAPQPPAVDWDALITEVVERGKEVPEVDWAIPGEDAAEQALNGPRGFLSKERMSVFSAKRNDPNSAEAVSHLSPYLHFGQLAPQRAALEAAKLRSKYKEGVDGFLEELIVRRELSDNFCTYEPNYDNLGACSEWAIDSLNKHRGDKREFIYTLEELEKGETQDELWNAAQLEMAVFGKMHGFMRMYWAKKILEWTESPEQALEFAIYLNDKYEIDGRDPNGYVGCMWSIGGIHDQGWAERPVFGKIRYMNYNGCKRKFDVKAYIKLISDRIAKLKAKA